MTHARNQDGFALVEVIVSAAVLAIVALAVLAGIDGATASTARERARAVAASLAEQDQERLRSFRFDELTKLAGLDPGEDTLPPEIKKLINRSLEVGGVTYAVKTKVDFQVDSGAPTTGCGTAGAKQNEYLRIITTVTSSVVGTRVAPVKIESLVAPPVSGSLVVKVLNAKGLGVVGADVAAKAKSGRVYSGKTDDQGCIPFVGIESGAFTVTAAKPGHVDKAGKAPAEKETTVSPNLVNVLTMSLDIGVDLTVNIRTLRPGETWTSTATSYPSKAANVSDNSADPNTLRTYTPASPASTIIAPKVFPFSSGYSFFTGKCSIQSPVKVGLTNYFSVTNPAAVVIADSGKSAAELTATVYQPALNLRINSNSDLSSSYRIDAYLLDVGTQSCADFQPTRLALKTWPSSGWGTAPSGARNWVVQDTTDFDPGLPFGTYRICVRNNSGNWLSRTYENTGTHRSSTMEIPTSGYASTVTGCSP